MLFHGRGVNSNNPLRHVIGPLAWLQLGRAQKMMGDEAAARKSYETSLDLWNADPDIVFDLDYEDLEYGYRFDGPWDPASGQRFDHTRILFVEYLRLSMLLPLPVAGRSRSRPQP